MDRKWVQTNSVRQPVTVVLVVIALVHLSCSRVESSPSIEGSRTRGSGVNELQRFLGGSNSLNPFEKPIVEYMTKIGDTDASRQHIKHLFREQDSADFVSRLSSTQILLRSRFEHEAYNITSEDGYITQAVRIINPLVPSSLRKQPPVVLYGGQGVSAAVFLMASMDKHAPVHWPLSAEWPDQANGPNRSLAITLANNGYDVWLVGARGSDAANMGRVQSGSIATDAQSRHKIPSHLLDRVQSVLHGSTYWSFSHDEIIQFEFKTQLKFVMSASRQDKLTLITYSNGGFIAHAFASFEPEFARRHIDTMISLAPAVFTNKFNLVLGTTGLLSSLAPPNTALFDAHLDSFARGLWYQVCKSKVQRYSKCKTALNMLYGFSDHFQTNIELCMLEYIGRPVSLSGFRQSLQCGFSGRLQRYDYGILGNLQKYKQILPPEYELKRLALPRNYIISGEKDAIADQLSIGKLLGACGTRPLRHIQVPGYNHLDMLAAWNVDAKVNAPILGLLDDRILELSYFNETAAHDRQQVDNEFRGDQQVGSELRGGQQMDAELHGGQQVGSELRKGQQVGAELRGGQQVGSELRGGQQMDAELRGGQQEGSEYRGGQQVGAEQRGDQQVDVELRAGHDEEATAAVEGSLDHSAYSEAANSAGQPERQGVTFEETMRGLGRVPAGIARALSPASLDSKKSAPEAPRRQSANAALQARALARLAQHGNKFELH